MYKVFLVLLLVNVVYSKKYRTRNGANISYSLGFNGFNVNNKINIQSIKNNINLPNRFDWREKANVPIRDQKNCGSCWAFATVSPIEYIYTYKTGLPIHISEQELISCNSYGYNCVRGGWWDYNDLINYGIVLNDVVPYNASDIQCNISVPFFNKLKVTEWNYIQNDINEIKSAIYQYGPVASGISVDVEFYRYIDGIYDHNSTGYVNHAIVLVGWDDELHSWILRNSWSEKWGSNGYMYIEYGTSLVGSNAAYVIIHII